MKHPIICPGRLPAALLLSALLQGAIAQSAGAIPEGGPADPKPGDSKSVDFWSVDRRSIDILWYEDLQSPFGPGDAFLINRWDLRLHALGLTLRGQITDKRPLPVWERLDEALTAPGAALYHDATGSRFLYGIISETGLSARLRNPAGRGIPFFENHGPSGADLKTEPSATGIPGFYLNLTSPYLGPVSGFASAYMDAEELEDPRWGGGLRFRFGPRTSLGLEGLYTGSTLPPRSPKTWFSADPALPERDYRLFGGSAVFTAPFVSVASDLAYSETFAFGRDLYGNLGLTVGDRPWRVSLAADSAGDRFVGSDGTDRGALFRSAGRFEWRFRRSSLFRLSTSLRASGIGEPFTRSSSLLSYRFPTPSRESIFALSRVSLTVSRDLSDREEVSDRLDASLGFLIGPVRSTLQGSLRGLAEVSGDPGPYPGFEDRRFEALQTSGELSYNFSPFQVRAKLGFLREEGKEDRWAFSASGSLRKKFLRVSVKVGTEELGGPWSFTVSYRLNYSTDF